MKSRMLWGVGLATLLSVGVYAQSQTQDQTRNPSTDRRVTVKGCLIPDSSASASETSKSFTLSQADITKDEPVGKSSNVVKDAAKDTGAAASEAGKATASAVTGQKDKKELQLKVTTERDVNIDLASQINHKVELVGIMSAADVAAAKGKDKDKAAMSTMPLTLKAASVKSLSDKCD